MINSLKQLVQKLYFLFFLIGSLLIFAMFTDPTKLPIGLILLVLVWFYLIFSLSTYHILGALKLRAFEGSGRRLSFYSFMAGLVPTLILMLISVNQLTIKDLLLLSVLGVVTLVYISRFRIR